MRWATRRHCHVDRAACAWLIRRFLDPEAEFVFVDDPDEVPRWPTDRRNSETRSKRDHRRKDHGRNATRSSTARSPSSMRSKRRISHAAVY
jgi:ChrB, C-terminal domain